MREHLNCEFISFYIILNNDNLFQVDVFEEVLNEIGDKILKTIPNVTLTNTFGIISIVIETKTKQNFNVDELKSYYSSTCKRKQFKNDKSIMAFPVLENDNNLLGVVEFINKIDPITGCVTNFNGNDEDFVLKIMSFLSVFFCMHRKTKQSMIFVSQSRNYYLFESNFYYQ